MKIEIKKISFNERMSEETSCFVADLYIDGKKVGYCKNDGHGGCTDIHGNSKEDYKIIAEAMAYCKTLPKVKYHNSEWEQDLEWVVNMQLEEYLNAKQKAKTDKKMQKLMQTAILVGVPNANSYNYFNFKRPLSTIPRTTLQAQVALIKMKNCKDGRQILNTNLQALGVTF